VGDITALTSIAVKRRRLHKGAWQSRLTITNRTRETLSGVYLVLDRLPRAARLLHKMGSTAKRSPYVRVDSDATLAPGETVTLILRFAGSKPVAFVPRLWAGGIPT
jgi:hypothetical protein